MSTELDIIKHLRNLFPRIGDDAESFSITRGLTPVVSIDSFVNGVHFDLSFLNPYDAGYRSCAATLSDIAAMGAKPKVLLCSLGLPEGDKELVDSIARGIKTLAEEFDTEVIGGDTVRSNVLFMSLCAIGETKKPVRRSGAKIGELICVTGNLGGSAAGLVAIKKGLPFKEVVERYTHPKPKIDQGLVLAKYATSMIDVSDGLAIDLYHILEESKVGALIKIIPVEKGAMKIAPLVGEKPHDYALYGGEDFELLFTVDKGNLHKLEVKMDYLIIGEIVKEGMRMEDGTEIKLGGYDHFSHSTEQRSNFKQTH